MGRGVAPKPGLSETSVIPVNYQELPNLVAESFHHAFSAVATIDMTPGTGGMALSAVLAGTGYVGICQTEFQKDFIHTRLRKEILNNMSNPASKVYSSSYAAQKRPAEADPKKEAKKPKIPVPKGDPKPKPKSAPPGTQPDEQPDPTPKPKAKSSAELSAKLAALLNKAKGGEAEVSG